MRAPSLCAEVLRASAVKILDGSRRHLRSTSHLAITARESSQRLDSRLHSRLSSASAVAHWGERMTEDAVGSVSPGVTLARHLAADPMNRVALLTDSQRMVAIAADLAPDDASLRTGLRAVTESGAGRLLLADRHPGPEVIAMVIQKAIAQGVGDDAARRSVRLLEAVLFGWEAQAPHPTPDPRRDSTPGSSRQVDYPTWHPTVQPDPDAGSQPRSRAITVLASVASLIVLVVAILLVDDQILFRQPSRTTGPTPTAPAFPSPTGLAAEVSPTDGFVSLTWIGVRGARRYEICQDDDCKQLYEPPAIFRGTPGARHTYRVSALGDGDRRSLPASVTVEVPR